MVLGSFVGLLGLVPFAVLADQSTNAKYLFSEEESQLTQASLLNLSSKVAQQLGINSTLADVFGFPNDTVIALKRSSANCKTYAGDSSWPSNLIWDAFSILLNGDLIRAPPLASTCYTNWENYDEEQCAYLTSNWHNNSFIHSDHPTSIMSPFYTGSTCMPPEEGSETANCTLGGYPYFVVNATNVAQIQLAINVARNLNLRLVIKNTGHDFSGKSAGEGALSIWTHNLKSLEYQPSFKGSTYSGAAIKMGSGVQANELYELANKYNVTVVAGEGESVGIAGGYLQGGGHSPLASIYGLAADQVIAYQVVTADGQFLTASDDENVDLFWALRGGGGSTFGVVTSATVKAWPQLSATVSQFTLTTGENLSSESFWKALRAFFAHFPHWADSGAYSYFAIEPLGADTYYFTMNPFFTPNMTASQHQALLQPWLDDLSALNVTLDMSVNASTFDNFYAAWAFSFPLEGVGYDAGRIASRLFPRANFANETLLDNTIAAIQNTTAAGFFVTAFNFKNELHPSNTANSANPAFRGALMHAIAATFWEDGDSVETMREVSDSLTHGCLDQWRAVTVGSGAYIGEADSSEPDWQQSFFGSHYDRLLEIKQRYDPLGVFYALMAVGTEDWAVNTATGLPTQNGKLCKV